MQVILSNPKHPEYGQVTIPLPLPRDQYDDCVELLKKLEIGSATEQDCQVMEISSAFPALKRLEMLTVNLDELDYLAKRLESFDVGEAAQFQAMAHQSEKKLLLRIADLEDELRDVACLNSFISGYRLAQGIQQELLADQQPYSFEAEDERQACEKWERRCEE